MTDREAIEHAAAIADVYFDAWKRRQAAAVTSRERRDFETMAIAATHIAAAIRELTTTRPAASDTGGTNE